MQLNFLQEDLLEILKKDKPAPLAPKSAAPSTPQQMLLLSDPLPEPKKPSVRERVIDEVTTPAPEEKSPAAFKTISEAAEILGVPAYVLRFWESQFPQISPTKSRGGRRYYRPEDMDVLSQIKHLLYKEGYTIKGARKAFSQMKQDVVLAAKPVPVHLPEAAKKTLITPRQKSQLSSIRSELMDLKDQLEPYLV